MATADLSIFSGLLQRPPSVADYTMQNQKVQEGALQLQQLQQGAADAAALREATKSFNDDPLNNLANLRKAGLYKPAQDYQKSVYENQKTQGEIGLNKSKAGEQDAMARMHALDTSIKTHNFALQKLQAITDPSQVPGWMAETARSQAPDSPGALSDEQLAQGYQNYKKASQSGDPDWFNKWKNQALAGGQSVDETLKQQQAKLLADNANLVSRLNNAETNQTRIQTTGMTVGQAERSSLRADARARESTAATMTKPFEVTGPDGTPILVQQDRQGNITPVQGFGPKVGSAKPLNDSQAKALGFGTRMQEADKLLNGLEAKGVSTPSLAKMAVGDTAFLGPLANMASSPDQQSVDQAQRDFVNAILRRESGAAISSSEFDNARRQYFSQPGDSQQVKVQKAANRKLAMQGVLAEVPAGQRGTIGPGASNPPGGAPAAAGGFKIVKVQ